MSKVEGGEVIPPPPKIENDDPYQMGPESLIIRVKTPDREQEFLSGRPKPQPRILTIQDINL
jgi:hypothetical protein